MNSYSSVVTAPSADSINALGNNIALVFAAAKESGQSEAVVREALALFNSVTVMPRNDIQVYTPQPDTSDESAAPFISR